MARISTDLSRREALLSVLASAALIGSPAGSQSGWAMHVVKGTGCECCSAWVAHLRDEGFVVTEEELYGTQLLRFKSDKGVPPKMLSCHTGTIGGYVVEGHVPARDILRLLAEAPDAIGLAVPGMPYGSPGMGNESKREAYDVHLIGGDGTISVFTAYPGT
jgi:hypothetical protein